MCVYVCIRVCVCIYICVCVCARGRTAKFVEPIEPDGGPNDGQRGTERKTNLFLSVLCFSFRFCTLHPARPSALGVSFTAKPLRAKLVNSSVTIRQANPPPPIVPSKWSTINGERPSVCTSVLHRRIQLLFKFAAGGIYAFWTLKMKRESELRIRRLSRKS